MPDNYYSEVNDHGNVIPIRDLAAVAWADAGKSVKKNWLLNKAVSTGIFTVNTDKSVSINANASSDVTLDINSEITISETMILTGCPSGGMGSKYQLVAKIGSTYLTDNGEGVQLAAGTYRIYILIKSGYGNGLVFKPMLTKEGVPIAPYEPYIPDNTELFPRSEQAVLGAKNLLLYPYKSSGSVTSNGITYTINNNGSVLLDGTTTGYSDLQLHARLIDPMHLPTGDYIISGGYSEKVRFTIGRTYNGAWQLLGSSIGDEVIVHIDEADDLGVSLEVIQANVTVNNVLMKPMIRLASDTDSTWYPFVPTNKKIMDIKWDKDLVKINSSEDLNDYKKAGGYFWEGTAPVNAPESQVYSKMIVLNANGIVHQIVIRGNGYIAMRQYDSGTGTWRNWFKFTSTEIT